MFDIGWTEMLVVAAVAIIVVGPKDLPGMLRNFGRMIRKIRGMAGEFQSQFDEALKEAELDGVKDGIDSVRNLDPTKAIKDKLNPLSDSGSKKDDHNYDPETLFDEAKSPDVESGQTVDVESALEKQRKIDEEFAKVAPSSGANAVPGFGGPAADPLPEVAAAKEAAKAAAAKSAKPAAKTTSKQKSAAKPKAAAKKAASAKSTPAKAKSAPAKAKATPTKATQAKGKASSAKAAGANKSTAKKASAKKAPARKPAGKVAS